MRIYALGAKEISRLVARQANELPGRIEHGLDAVFTEILRVANEFVPSESGSIMLRVPESEGELVFIASFGLASSDLPGTRLPPGRGIAGKVLQTGRAVIRNDPSQDSAFYAEIDRQTSYRTRSILCVPITLHEDVCGVLSLLNRETGEFEPRDLDLLQVFSGYISTSIRNALDAQWHRELSRQDHLTGLYNDRYLFERLLRELERSEREGTHLGLLFLDLDQFKGVVDSHGHLVGSRIIREVGQLLSGCVDDPHAVLARYGGDEYVIMVPGADLEAMECLGEKIRTRVAEGVFLVESDAEGRPPVSLKGVLTASIGVASYLECQLKGETIEARRHGFIRVADEAMYAAKRAGKNQVMAACRLVSS